MRINPKQQIVAALFCLMLYFAGSSRANEFEEMKGQFARQGDDIKKTTIDGNVIALGMEYD